MLLRSNKYLMFAFQRRTGSPVLLFAAGQKRTSERDSTSVNRTH